LYWTGEPNYGNGEEQNCDNDDNKTGEPILWQNLVCECSPIERNRLHLRCRWRWRLRLTATGASRVANRRNVRVHIRRSNTGNGMLSPVCAIDAPEIREV